MTCIATVIACLLALGSFLLQLSPRGTRSVPAEKTLSPIEPLAGHQADGFEQFKEHWNKLDGRFREQEEFITECVGKTIDWIVVYDSPSIGPSDDVLIFFGSPAKESHELTKFERPVRVAVFSAREKERIFSLKRGDVIELRGTLNRLADELMVKGTDFQLVSPVSKPSQ